LAYGTPLQIHHAQHDVPVPAVKDVAETDVGLAQNLSSSIFIAFITLTEVLGRYLEHIYHVSKDFPPLPVSTSDFEILLSSWEGKLTDEVRRIVIRGTDINATGAPNLRLAYLAVKLLLKRIQLDLDRVGQPVKQDTDSQYFFQAQRASEEMVHLVQELNHFHLCGFWLPVLAFSLTSATTFLLKASLQSVSETGIQTPSFRMARDMVDTLRRHRRDCSWDLANHCLETCSDIVEKIGNWCESSSWTFTDDSGFLDLMSLDLSALDEFSAGF
jgi:hypothetical protein